MAERLLEIDGVSKQYRLGTIGGGYLFRDINSWIARKRGKEDPNSKIGSTNKYSNETFMALEDISFNVDRGDSLGLLGRNGAGKSTMLKLISRITAPTSGEIRVHGRIASLLEVGTGFHPELTGRENIYLNGAILGMSRSEITKKLDEIIEFSEISQFIDTPVKRYSSGMYVKLGFAVAAHLAPDILICDEVLAVGDLAFQQKCLRKMGDVANSGCAVLYVSHNMRTVSQLCSRALFLDSGKLVYDGTTAKAIDLYGGAGSREVVRDLDAMSRQRNFGSIMRMTKMEILNSTNMEYHYGSDMEFRLHFISNIDETGLRLRAIINSNVSVPIGTSHSRPFDVKAGEPVTLNVRLPLGSLSSGEYSLRLDLAAAPINGIMHLYDSLQEVGQFTVLTDTAENSGIYWATNVFGNMRMAPMEIF